MASLYQAKLDAKNKGMDYVLDKYGQNFVTRNKKALDMAVSRSPNRSPAFNRQSILNKPPTPTGRFVYEGGNASFMSGGETPVEQDMTNVYGNNMQLNLENDSGLAQGSHHQWAQPTSVSSLITGLLRQTQQQPQDYWSTWGANNNVNPTLTGRNSSSFGYDVNIGEQQMIGNNNMGAFGTNQVMMEQEEEGSTTTPYTPGSSNVPGDTTPTGGYYNPWGFGQGGDTNSYGPSQQHMSQATMEAMQLANQYFAPQRMELAYELGDMETDMRRLAANLGRQTDDPTLQAKLYKEAMRAVRTMDVQQNTLALQMADQRRREELQNFQYYDALSQEEYKLRLANRQFYEDLGLRSAYFNLENSIGMANPYSSNTTTTQGGNAQQQTSLEGIYSNLLNYNPY